MIGYHILRRFFPVISSNGNCCHSNGVDRLETLFGLTFWQYIADKTVLDFGCGEGRESIEMARHGARVIGLDIREDILATARANAARTGVSCQFARTVNGPVDVIISIDAFEHFQDPAAVLRHMHSLLRRDGKVLISFGPTWYHPLGGHLFSVFPWAHLLFSERDLCRWRSRFKSDGATRFCEVDGGLNQMTIRRFRDLVHNSPFHFELFETVPIGKLRPIHSHFTEEFTTSAVRCILAV